MRLEFEMRVLLAALAFVVLSAPSVRAQSVEEFYKGKTINLAIGFSVGGGYDLYARHLARHMGKHIPGNPAIVPQNMAGAGSLRAANFIYTAPRSAPSPAPPASIRCWKAARPSTAPNSPGSAASPMT
jgi:tripartite-type tricarboxylate transporter receptor subunit TctC